MLAQWKVCSVSLGCLCYPIRYGRNPSVANQVYSRCRRMSAYGVHIPILIHTHIECSNCRYARYYYGRVFTAHQRHEIRVAATWWKFAHKFGTGCERTPRGRHTDRQRLVAKTDRQIQPVAIATVCVSLCAVCVRAYSCVNVCVCVCLKQLVGAHFRCESARKYRGQMRFGLNCEGKGVTKSSAVVAAG